MEKKSIISLKKKYTAKHKRCSSLVFLSRFPAQMYNHP